MGSDVLVCSDSGDSVSWGGDGGDLMKATAVIETG